MTDEQIVVMLSEILENVDYDIWKEVFHYTEDGQELLIADLITIVRKHLG
jgi:hypothetical protein